MSISEITDLLQKRVTQPGFVLREPAAGSLIEKAESVYNITLPDDFKTLYCFCDGFEDQEDMFNMISLAEIIEDYKPHDNAFFIAEYMTYCDAWMLEINPGDCNDYKITVNSYQGNKLILTNSLAEFIARFLKGGVFDEGGIYDWHDEIEAQPVYSTNPKSQALLLNVYQHGLMNGIISRSEVIDWADRIILHEDNPDYFFTEISLAGNLNDLIAVITPLAAPDSGASLRALFGLIYHRLLNDSITPEAALAAIDKYHVYNTLTRREATLKYNLMYQLWRDGATQSNVPKQDVLKFLAIYKDFELTNHRKWGGISYVLEQKLNTVDRSAINATQKVTTRTLVNNKRKTRTYIAIGVLLLFVVFIAVVDYQFFVLRKPATMFGHKITGDEVSICNLVFITQGASLGYKFWQMRHRRR